MGGGSASPQLDDVLTGGESGRLVGMTSDIFLMLYSSYGAHVGLLVSSGQSYELPRIPGLAKLLSRRLGLKAPPADFLSPLLRELGRSLQLSPSEPFPLDFPLEDVVLKTSEIDGMLMVEHDDLFRSFFMGVSISHTCGSL